MNFKHTVFSLLCLSAISFVSCKRDGNPNDLPDVSLSDYEGKIDGFNTSEEIYPSNLIAYWNFDGNKNEQKTGTAPARDTNITYVTGGVRGQAINLAAGYLYYPNQFQVFKTDSFKSWTISMWARIANNGSKRTMLFQLARPGMFNGNINVALNTQSYPATNDSVLRLQPTFAAVNTTNGTSNFQDNLNNVLDKVRLNKWTHIVLTYNIATGLFNNWIDGVNVGAFSGRGTTNLFRSWEPSEVIIGSNYNGISGKAVSTDVTFAPMTGQLDELRIWNTALPDAFIRSLNNLGKAGK